MCSRWCSGIRAFEKTVCRKTPVATTANIMQNRRRTFEKRELAGQFQALRAGAKSSGMPRGPGRYRLWQGGITRTMAQKDVGSAAANRRRYARKPPVLTASRPLRLPSITAIEPATTLAQVPSSACLDGFVRRGIND
jgi:hypothetical protein